MRTQSPQRSRLEPAACSVLAALLAFAAPARADTVAISGGDCAQLVQHVPQADVTYKPGVDVHGKPVVPADVGGGYQVPLPEQIDIQIGIDLADRLGLQASKKPGAKQPATRKVMPFSGYAPLGTLSIKGNDAYWNGQPLASQDQMMLAEACRRGLTSAGVTLPMPKPPPPR